MISSEISRSYEKSGWLESVLIENTDRPEINFDACNKNWIKVHFYNKISMKM